MSNGNLTMTICSVAGLIKKLLLYKMSQYFSNPYERFSKNVKIKLDLCNQAAKADLKVATGVNTSNFPSKLSLARLKGEVDKKDIGKLRIVPVNLSNRSNVVNNDVVKKIVYDELITKVNVIDTSEFVLKTQYDNEKSGLEKKVNDADKKNLILVSLLKNLL